MSQFTAILQNRVHTSLFMRTKRLALLCIKFRNVHGIMNTSGLLQSNFNFARDPKYS